MAETTNYGWPQPDPQGNQQPEIQRIADAFGEADATVKGIADALAALNAAYDAHTHSFASITDKPTTLAGYGITDAYTKGQVDTEIATKISAAIAAVIDGAPGAIDTLNELAAALGDDPNFATTMTNLIAAKLNASDYTAADILAKLLTVDGPSSGLSVSQAANADKLDNKDSAAFAQLAANNAFTGDNTFNHSRLAVKAVSAGGDAGTFLRDSSGTLRGNLYWSGGAQRLINSLYSDAGASLGYYTFDGNNIYINSTGTGNKVWHAGNLTPSDYAKLSDANVTFNSPAGVGTFEIQSPHSSNAQRDLRTGSYYLSNFYGVGFTYFVDTVGSPIKYLSNWGAGVRTTIASFSGNVADFKATPTVNGQAVWHAGNFDPGDLVYTGSNAGATVFPVGHSISVRNTAGAMPKLNGLVSGLQIAPNQYCYYNSGSGPALSGTWRSRGSGEDNTAATVFRAERVA